MAYLISSEFCFYVQAKDLFGLNEKTCTAEPDWFLILIFAIYEIQHSHTKHL
jgi:hypothetical protein